MDTHFRSCRTYRVLLRKTPFLPASLATSRRAPRRLKGRTSEDSLALRSQVAGFAESLCDQIGPREPGGQGSDLGNQRRLRACHGVQARRGRVQSPAQRKVSDVLQDTEEERS